MSVPEMPSALAAMLAEHRLVHALCLEGSPQPALELAKRLAGAVLCDEQKGEMCGECTPCRKVLAGVHADVTIPDWEKDGYKKDALRSLRSQIYRSPHEGRAKVMIFPEAQTMSAEAQNLLLKVMEEPPPDTFFILLCENRYRLLGTVLSRMVSVTLPQPDDSQLMDTLLQSDEGQLAKAVLEAVAQGNGYRMLTALVPAEKNRQLYAAVLESANRLLGIKTMRETLGIESGRAILLRQQLSLALERNDSYGSLPLISAAFAEGIAGK